MSYTWGNGGVTVVLTLIIVVTLSLSCTSCFLLFKAHGNIISTDTDGEDISSRFQRVVILLHVPGLSITLCSGHEQPGASWNYRH